MTGYSYCYHYYDTQICTVIQSRLLEVVCESVDQVLRLDVDLVRDYLSKELLCTEFYCPDWDRLSAWPYLEIL